MLPPCTTALTWNFFPSASLFHQPNSMLMTRPCRQSSRRRQRKLRDRLAEMKFSTSRRDSPQRHAVGTHIDDGAAEVGTKRAGVQHDQAIGSAPITGVVDVTDHGE